MRSALLVTLIPAVLFSCKPRNFNSDADTASTSTKMYTCSYDASKGPNPLGMRTYVSMRKTGATIEASYDHLPDGFIDGTYKGIRGETRKLVMEGNDLAAARNKIRANPSLWSAVVGFAATVEDFKDWEKVVACGEQDAPKQEADVKATCYYNPDGGKPNPLGMRHFVTLTQVGPDVMFKNTQFPAFVSQGAAASYEVTVQVMNVNVEQARKLFVDSSKKLSGELLGAEKDMAKDINATLICK